MPFLASTAYALSLTVLTALFPGDPVPFSEQNGSGWHALCLDEPASLKKVTLTVQPKGPLVVDGCGSSLVFLRGEDWLSERPIKTYAAERKGNATEIVAPAGKAVIESVEESPDGPQLVIRRGRDSQAFWTKLARTWDQWEVVWAGDINDDQLPDFVVHSWSAQEQQDRGYRAIFVSEKDPKLRQAGLYIVAGEPFERPRPR